MPIIEERMTQQEFLEEQRKMILSGLSEAMKITIPQWRENFAACALNGLLASGRLLDEEVAVRLSVSFADALIAELNGAK